MKIKGFIKILIICLIMTGISISFLFATPSTVYWTPCTPYFQPYMKGHITYDTYVRTNNALPITYGFTIGVLPSKKFQMEVGYDTMLPVTVDSDEQHFFNAKMGSPESELLPIGFSIGIFSKGIKTDVTDYDIYHFNIGKTFKIG
ncbi:MAG: hypothetical protein ACK4WJ_06080, partial [Endomicrobiia bacterium]